MTIHLQYPDISLKLQHVIMRHNNYYFHGRRERTSHFIHRLYFTSMNRHISDHITSEGPIHNI